MLSIWGRWWEHWCLSCWVCWSHSCSRAAAAACRLFPERCHLNSLPPTSSLCMNTCPRRPGSGSLSGSAWIAALGFNSNEYQSSPFFWVFSNLPLSGLFLSLLVSNRSGTDGKSWLLFRSSLNQAAHKVESVSPPGVFYAVSGFSLLVPVTKTSSWTQVGDSANSNDKMNSHFEFLVQIDSLSSVALASAALFSSGLYLTPPLPLTCDFFPMTYKL